MNFMQAFEQSFVEATYYNLIFLLAQKVLRGYVQPQKFLLVCIFCPAPKPD